MLNQRIGIFTALPIKSLDQLSLQNRLRDIGRMQGAIGRVREPMLMPPLAQRAFCEWLGTAFLLMGVVGSGIMAQRLSGGNDALALLCNTLPTGAILTVLILVFGPLSGAHFNPGRQPGVRAAACNCRGRSPAVHRRAASGGIAGVWAAHLMFELPVVQFSVTVRTGTGQWFAEAVRDVRPAADDLRLRGAPPAAVPIAVGLYITAAYWFTASTSFANPASPLPGRFPTPLPELRQPGIAAFLLAQLAGMVRGGHSESMALARGMIAAKAPAPDPRCCRTAAAQINPRGSKERSASAPFAVAVLPADQYRQAHHAVAEALPRLELADVACPPSPSRSSRPTSS